MIKCLLCDCTKETAREMHGHLVRMHYDEYGAKGFDMEVITEGYVKKRKDVKEMIKNEKSTSSGALKNDRPKNLRLLNKLDREELEAYNEGFRYFDPDEMMAYTSSEVKEEGWI